MTESINKQPYQPIDRRPIQSRNTQWAQAISQLLVNLNLSPNAISLFGMLAAVTAGILFYSTDMVTGIGQRALWFGGGILCQIRLLCNLFDGMVAIKRGIASAQGELYNEIPDRVSDAAVFIGLGYAAGGHITFGYMAALISIFVAYVRATAKSIGAPNDFCGPMAKPQRMALATVVALSMALFPYAWRWPWGQATVVLVVVIVGGMVTALRRLARAAKYLEREAAAAKQ